MKEEQSIAIVDSEQLALQREPKLILAEAKRAADALQEIIKGKKKPVVFNGEQYVEFEDWQVLGKFYGLFAKVVDTQPVDFNGVTGFKARAVIVDVRTGLEVSSAEAMCLNDEENWGTRPKFKWVDGKRVQDGTVNVPTFQLLSMAQTRASAKAFRNVLSWVVVLAGYKPTPAEEMSAIPETKKPDVPQPQAKSAQATQTTSPQSAQLAGDTISEPQAKRLFAIATSAKWSKEELKQYLKDFYAVDHSTEIRRSDYEAICEYIQNMPRGL